LLVVKNALLKKAFNNAKADYSELEQVLAGPTSIMFSDMGNEPAKLIKDFRRTHAKPVFKAAYVQESIYIGEENFDALVNLKSKNELIADIIFLLQSPMRNVLSSLQSGSNIITGVLTTLAERDEKSE